MSRDYDKEHIDAVWQYGENRSMYIIDLSQSDATVVQQDNSVKEVLRPQAIEINIFFHKWVAITQVEYIVIFYR